MKNKKVLILHTFLAIVLIMLDQITKLLVQNNLQDHDIIIWQKVFRLTYVRNTGAAWGMLSNGTLILTIISLIISIIVIGLYIKLPSDVSKFNILKLILVFVLAGAVGNIIDRIRLKYVIDFFYFELIDFPVFNVADCYITVSMVVLAVLLIFYYREEDFDAVFQKKNKPAEKEQES